MTRSYATEGKIVMLIIISIIISCNYPKIRSFLYESPADFVLDGAESIVIVLLALFLTNLPPPPPPAWSARELMPQSRETR